jgi:hypothetical protein
MHLRIYNTKERRAIYERIAEQTRQAYGIGLPVKVYYFESDTVDFLTDRQVEGRVNLSGNGYAIGLRRGLKLETELATLAHEVAHIVLNHPRQIATQAELDASDIRTAQILNEGETSKNYQVYFEREKQTDELAAQTLKDWRAQGVQV